MLSERKMQRIARRCKSAGDVVGLEKLKVFFYKEWPFPDMCLEEGSESEEKSDDIGEPLYHSHAKLKVTRCKAPSLITDYESFALTPEGFGKANENRKTDRNTWIGKSTEGVDACDIVIHQNDRYCKDRHAVIEHKSDGYYISDLAMNELFTRVELMYDDRLQMIPGVLLSFGLYDVMTVVNVNPHMLEIFWLIGGLAGQTTYVFRHDSPANTGRARSNKIFIPSKDVSNKHGRFVYIEEDEDWFYELDGHKPTNGTWEGVSLYDMTDHRFHPHEGTRLRNDDNIMIGSTIFRFTEFENNM